MIQSTCTLVDFTMSDIIPQDNFCFTNANNGISVQLYLAEPALMTIWYNTFANGSTTRDKYLPPSKLITCTAIQY